LRQIEANVIKDTVKELFLRANYVIGEDVYKKLAEQIHHETSEVGRSILKQIMANDDIAKCENIAICQDTGMAIIFAQLGQEVSVVGGDFNGAINQGVREAYTEGYLRKSVVAEPLFDRKNTGDNNPAVLHLTMVPGDKLRLLVTAKGFGSENMSAVAMLKPADGVKGVTDFVVQTVIKAGPNPCPPTVIGVGIGGTMEMAAIIAKKATTRTLGEPHPDPRYAQLEKDILSSINKSGIGPGGLGGSTTSLAVHAEYYATHIAGLPVAVNICCHAVRHAEKTI